MIFGFLKQKRVEGSYEVDDYVLGKFIVTGSAYMTQTRTPVARNSMIMATGRSERSVLVPTFRRRTRIMTVIRHNVKKTPRLR